jgi:hypothetical protein
MLYGLLCQYPLSSVSISQGGTPLHWAAWNGHLDAMKALCSNQSRDVSSGKVNSSNSESNVEKKELKSSSWARGSCLRGISFGIHSMNVIKGGSVEK